MIPNLKKVRNTSLWQTVPKFWFIWLCYISFCINYKPLPYKSTVQYEIYNTYLIPLFQLAVTLVLIRRFLIQANICKAIPANSLTRLDRFSQTHYCSRNDIVSAMKHECNSTQFHTRNSIQQCSSDYGISKF